MLPISTNALVVPDKADNTTIVGSVSFVTSRNNLVHTFRLTHTGAAKLHYFHFVPPSQNLYGFKN